jgi:hypothetical protein
MIILLVTRLALGLILRAKSKLNERMRELSYSFILSLYLKH